MKLRYLIEKFIESTKAGDGSTGDIFVDPSPDEMEDASGKKYITRAPTIKPTVRFFTLKGKVYITSPQLLHHVSIKKLGLGSTMKLRPEMFEGIAEKRGTKWVCIESHQFSQMKQTMTDGVSGAVKRIKEYVANVNEMKYVQKYIDITEFMNKEKAELRMIKGFKNLK